MDLQGGKCDVLLHADATVTERKGLKRRLGLTREYVIGQGRIIAVVNKRCAASKLDYKKIGGLLKQIKKGDKREFPAGFAKNTKCYVEAGYSWGREILQWRCLTWQDKNGGGRYRCLDDVVQCASSEEVVTKVKADRNGIGFILYNPYDAGLAEALKKVKVLAIGGDSDRPYVTPKLGAVIQDDYPLSEPLILYLHPKAPAIAKAFCEFAVSEAGAKIAGEQGLITPWHQKEYEGELRLAEYKRGKGERMFVVGAAGSSAGGVGGGSVGGKVLMGELNEAYVLARELVRVQYLAAGSDVAAAGLFVGKKGKIGKEILILDDRLGDQAVKVHGERWSELDPVEHMAAARVVALVVNPQVTVKSLTLGQVEGIFAGKTREWNLLGGGDGKITCYGLRRTVPAAKVFAAEGLPGVGLTRVSYKKTTAEVLEAVSMDASGIGFVDLSEIPASGQTVRVLEIGKAGKSFGPTAAAIRSGMYPLARRLFVYISPSASKTAKGFVKFITSPAADTVWRKAGHVSLSKVLAVK